MITFGSGNLLQCEHAAEAVEEVTEWFKIIRFQIPVHEDTKLIN